MFRVTFLGTGGSIPQVERNPSSVAVEREGDLLLFDCGEGTQRQMMKHGTGFDVDSVFVSHVHGDHVLGLPGLFQTWTFQGRDEGVEVYCPRGVGDAIRECVGLVGHRPQYDVDVTELDDGDVVDADGYEVRAFETAHGKVESLGYVVDEGDRKGRFDRERAEEFGVPPHRFSELHEGGDVELEDGTVVRSDEVVGEARPGRKVVYTGDTRPTERTAREAEGACLLVHDGMFASELEDRAVETGHSTAGGAAQVAAGADVDLLALTHVSSRYSADASPLEEEARQVFEDCFVAYDGDRVVVEYPDKERDTRRVEEFD